MRNIKIGTKIAGMVGSLLLLMIIASGYGVYKINRIGDELREISEELIPLSELVTESTISQLEQAVWFERFLLLAQDSSSKNELADAKKQFNNYSRVFDDNFQKAVKLTKLATEKRGAEGAGNLQKEYQTLLKHLGVMEKSHTEYEKHVGHMHKLLSAKDSGDSKPHIKMLKIEERKLIDEMEGILKHIVKLSKKTAHKANLNGVAATKHMITLALFSMIIGISMTLIFSRQIISPIKGVVASLKDIAQGEGDLTARIKVKGEDEVGELARWFNLFLDKIQKMVKETAGNTDTLNVSASKLLDLSDIMSSGAEETLEISENVTRSAEIMDSNMSAVASAVSHASGNVEGVASAAEQLTRIINQINQNTDKAESVTKKAITSVNNASSRVGDLGLAASDIDKVTESITEISEQTNLLALNATIEAARAGEAGKGFAVVANEIKELAKQTAEATLDIKSKVEGIQKSTGLTVKEIEQVTEIINEINEIVISITGELDEQSNFTREIADNAVQASSGIKEVDTNVNQASTVAKDIASAIRTVNNSARNTAQGSVQVKSNASELMTLSGELKNMVNQFKV